MLQYIMPSFKKLHRNSTILTISIVELENNCFDKVIYSSLRSQIDHFASLRASQTKNFPFAFTLRTTKTF